MYSGVARNRSGPAANENSERSDRRGYKLTALPAEYDGPVPEWPSVNPRPRDLAWWEWAWKQPQACAWSMPSERWRIPFVAEWCEAKADLEIEDKRTAANKAAKFRMEDRIGFSTAGLAEMGWKVTVDELSERRDEPATPPTVEDDEMTARRKRAISGGA